MEKIRADQRQKVNGMQERVRQASAVLTSIRNHFRDQVHTWLSVFYYFHFQLNVLSLLPLVPLSVSFGKSRSLFDPLINTPLLPLRLLLIHFRILPSNFHLLVLHYLF
mgnify:CR=1 FL=1